MPIIRFTVSGIATTAAGGWSLARTFPEQSVWYIVVAVAFVAAAGLAKAIQVQHELDAHLDETREAAAEVRSTVEEFTRTTEEE